MKNSSAVTVFKHKEREDERLSETKYRDASPSTPYQPDPGNVGNPSPIAPTWSHSEARAGWLRARTGLMAATLLQRARAQKAASQPRDSLLTCSNRSLVSANTCYQASGRRARNIDPTQMHWLSAPPTPVFQTKCEA